MALAFGYVAKANRYAQDVVDGRVLACKWVRLACERHLNDLELSAGANYPWRFDQRLGNRICAFAEDLPHVKGKWAKSGELIVLQPWQCFILASLFGWVGKDDGFRRFRRSLALIPRKNGKSLLAAVIGLYMLVEDGEAGAEIYSGATTEQQAWEVFRPALQMVQRTEEFREHYDVTAFAKSIALEENGSFFKPLIGDPGDGASPSLYIGDEVHEHKSSSQIDTMETGMGARSQPLSFLISTAGSDMAGPCYALVGDGRRMLESIIEDDRFFYIEFGIDADDDWASPEALRKANPNFGVSVGEDYLLSAQKQAIAAARKQGPFKTKHLNVWVGARDAFFNVESWRRCSVGGLKLEDFYGRRGVIGLDLASKRDIAAIELLILPTPADPLYTRFGWSYLPYAAIEGEENEIYQGWEKEGHFIVTDGNVTDYEEIRDHVLELCGQFSVEKVAYDPYQATMLCNELMAQGVPMLEYRATVQNYSDAMKSLDALIIAGTIRHDGNPVMEWQVGNVTAKEDAKSNVYPRKENERNKIDNPVALISAVGVAGVPTEGGPSVYEDRGIRVLGS